MVKGKRWILAKSFEGVPNEENLKLYEYELSEELQQNGKNQKY